MAVSRAARDTAYLLIVGTQLFAMLALDLVQFYPKMLWAAPSSPLHFLVNLRSNYASLSHDPFYVQTDHEPWFQAFMLVELVAQLPLSLYLVYELSKKTSGPGKEFAGLAFGCLTGMGSVTCCYVLVMTDEAVLAADKKAVLVWGAYLPFAIIPTLMAFDMHQRLLARINASARVKTQ